MVVNTSFRPTAYRDLHIGGAWNAYQNWLVAKRTGGEFVLVQDDMWMLFGGAWGGLSPLEGVERYKEDLAWLGFEVDRVEWGMEKPKRKGETKAERKEREEYNRWRAERHGWAAEILGYRKPIQYGELPVLASLYRVEANVNAFGDRAAYGGIPLAGHEGQLARNLLSWCPYHMACCVIDDIDFRIGAWVGGLDQLPYWAWCTDAYCKLGYNPPVIMFHPTLKRTEQPDKISKSDPTPSALESTIRNLRAAGYEAEEILETLRALSLQSCAAGQESIVIPHGILECGTKGVLKHAAEAVVKAAAGEFDAGIPEPYRASAQRAAKVRLAEGTGARRWPHGEEQRCASG